MLVVRFHWNSRKASNAVYFQGHVLHIRAPPQTQQLVTFNSGATSSARWIKGLFPIVGISNLSLREARSWLYSPEDLIFGPDANWSGLVTWPFNRLTTSWSGSFLAWSCPLPHPPHVAYQNESVESSRPSVLGCHSTLGHSHCGL